MLFFDSEDGARLAYKDEGKGLPLVALAGLTRDGRDFDYLARHLPDGVRLIRLDSRGRGRSQWTGAQTYTVAQEVRDVLALLDHLGVERAAFLGSSRGGLVGMSVAALHKQRVLGVCLNDVGAVLQRDGLLRIGAYIGLAPTVSTLEEIADRLPGAMPGFHRVSDSRWAEEAIRHFDQFDGRLGLTYDPALRLSFQDAMAGPPPDGWPLFEACADLPLAVVRGANSDVLARSTVEEMRRRRPDLLFAEVPDRGHIPFLDEPAALGCISAWLAQVALVQAQAAAADQCNASATAHATPDGQVG